MWHQLRADLLRLRTTRTVAFYALALAALTGFAVVITAVTAGSGDFEPLSSLSTQTSMATTGTSATLLAMFLGAVTLSGELRHKTIVPTLLATPSRGTVVASSAVATALAGALLGVVATVTAVGGTYAVLLATGTDAALTVEAWLAPSLGTIGASALAAVLGVGIGGIVRNQAIAVAAIAVLVFVVSPLLVAFAPDLAVWLPSSVSSAVAAAGDGTDPSLAPALAALVAYGVVAVAGAWAVLQRAEIH